MNLKASEILQRFKGQGLILDCIGPDNVIGRFAPIDECAAGDLVFIDNAKYLPLVRERKPAAVITNETIAADLREEGGLAILLTKNIRLATALVKQAYDDRDFYHTEWPRIHPSSVIHPLSLIHI